MKEFRKNNHDPVFDVWQAQLKEASKRPWLASLLLQKGREIYRRFVHYYQALQSLSRRSRRQLTRKFAVGLGSLALAMAISGGPVLANNIAVTITDHGINDGDGECSLVEAIITANDTSDGDPFGPDCAAGDPTGSDTIQLSGNTYLVDYAYSIGYGPTGLPDVTSDITIEGNGAIIQGVQPAPRGEGVGGTPFRIMAAADGSNLTIDNTTLTGGSATADNYDGGAIYGYAASITITNTAVISGNVAAGDGGGIGLFGFYAPTDLQVINSTISGNTSLNADGGGIYNFNYYNDSIINIVDSNISNNQASDSGGGIYNLSYYYDATVIVSNSTISGNHSNVVGGGIYNASYYDANTIVNNSTISGNTAVGPGGGILNDGVYISSVTVENNSQILNNTSYYVSGGGIANFANYMATVTVQSSSVISGNQAAFGPALPLENPEGPPHPLLIISAGGGGGIYNSSNNFALLDLEAHTRSSIFSQRIPHTQRDAKNEQFEPSVIAGLPPPPAESIVTIENSIVTGNQVNGSGGGIKNISTEFSAVYVQNNAAVTNNAAMSALIPAGIPTYANGGGIHNSSDCAICIPLPLSRPFNNHQTPVGAPPFGTLSAVVINDSTVSGNTADFNGGGIYNYANGRAYVDLINTATISNNSAYGIALPRPEEATTSWTKQRNEQPEAIAGPIVGLPPFGFGGGVLNLSNYGGGGKPGAVSPDDINGLPPGYSQLLIDNSTISGNTSSFIGGGAANISYGVAYNQVRNDANIINNESTDAYGGGLSNVGFYVGASVIEESTISGNSASSSGGGINNTSPIGNAYLYIDKSTISGNSAYLGGAFYNNHPGPGMAIIDATVNNSTISGNSADFGGGIYNYNGEVTLNHSTITDNNASIDGGGGIYNHDSGTVNLYNSIVAANPTGGDCSGTIISHGFNLDSDDSCIDNGVNNDITAADPLLGPLQLNTPGNTETHALLAGSLAIDAIPNSDMACGLLPDDQRGVTRPQGADACDIGAYERVVFTSFLPIIMNNPMPDLVITDLNVLDGNLSVTIENQGTSTVTDSFWVDLYLNPSPPPTAVNDVWDLLGPYGVAWGVTENLAPGESLVLTLNDSYYDPTESNMPDTIPAGTAVYAQVDAAHVNTSFGGVLENHESNGDPYNNISGPETTNSPITASIQKIVANIKSWFGAL